MYLIAWLVAAILIPAGLTLATWALFWDRPRRGKQRCPRCWYDLASLTTRAASTKPCPTCPECGHTARIPRQLRRTRRRWGWAVAATLPLAGGTWLALWPTVDEHGWAAFVPTPVLLNMTFNDRLPRNSPLYSELYHRRFPQNRFWPGERAHAIRTLLRTLEESRVEEHRDRAVALLQWIGARDARITPALLHAAEHDPSPFIRKRAVAFLGAYLADAKRTIPLLIHLAQHDPDREVRVQAIWKLGDYGKLAHEALPLILSMLGDSDPDIRTAALHAGSLIGADPDLVVQRAISALAESSGDMEPLVAVLKHLGPHASPAAPLLNSMLEQRVEGWSEFIIALGHIGPAAAEALPELNHIVADPQLDPRSHHLAQAAIDSIEGKYPTMLHAHVNALDAPARGTRLAAAQQLRRWTHYGLPLDEQLVHKMIHIVETNTDQLAASVTAHALSNLREAHLEPIYPALRRHYWSDGHLGRFVLDRIAQRETRIQRTEEPNPRPR
jgi:HEAT repeat protein